MMELEWIDCDIKQPESSGFYLICQCGNDISTFGYFDAFVGDWFQHPFGGGCNLVGVNYWMSFPTAPEGNFFAIYPNI